MRDRDIVIAAKPDEPAGSNLAFDTPRGEARGPELAAGTHLYGQKFRCHALERARLT